MFYFQEILRKVTKKMYLTSELRRQKTRRVCSYPRKKKTAS